MIGEIIDIKTDRLFYWPAEVDRPALASNGHWIIRFDASRGLDAVCPVINKPWCWNEGKSSNEGLPPVDGAWSGAALAPDGYAPVGAVGCNWQRHVAKLAARLPAAAVRLGKRNGKHVAYGPTFLLLASDDAAVRVGINPVYYSAALDLGLEVWATSQDPKSFRPIQLRRNGEVVGLIMPVRLS